MIAYSKLGFHAGPACRCNGIGDFWQTLSAAGRPIYHKSADEYGTCFEAQSRFPQAITVYRMSTAGQGDGFNYDVPGIGGDYKGEPTAVALHHWQKTKSKLPPEFNKATWLELINEVDKNEAQWLSKFALEIARLANAEGYKVALFGFSAGEPELDHWRAMSSFLSYCAQNKDKCAIALHEYSLNKSDLFDGIGYKIGRFKLLHDVVDELKIARPTILITEFGWSYQDVPGVEIAMPQLAQVAEIYAQHANILGAAIWYLGGGSNWPNIGTNTQKLIKPLGDWAATYSTNIKDTETPNMELKFDTWHNAGVKIVKHIDAIRIAYQDETNKTIHYQTIMIPPGAHFEDGVHHIRFAPMVAAKSSGLVIDNITNSLPKHKTLKYATRSLDAITTLTIHHTVSPPDRAISDIAAYHIKADPARNKTEWPGIGYHFVIKDTGAIYQTNELVTKSYHAGTTNAPGDENLFSVGIALQGDFTSKPPPEPQIRAAVDLVKHLNAQLPKNVVALGHREMPGAQTQCPGNTYNQGWLDRIKQAIVVTPSPQTYDLLNYMRGDDLVTFELKFLDGRQERNQAQRSGSKWYIVKGENQGYYEQWSFDNTYIYLELDTSPADAADGTRRYYKRLTAQNATTFAPFCARFMYKNQAYTNSHYVQFYNKSNCVKHTQNSGAAGQSTTLVSHHDSFTFSHTGFKVNDVIKLVGNGETHYFAKGLGRVAWESPWGSAYISELHAPGQRPNIDKESIACL